MAFTFAVAGGHDPQPCAGTVYMRYCGWEIPEAELTVEQRGQRAVENTTFYHCGCGWGLDLPGAVTLTRRNVSVDFDEPPVCLLPEDVMFESPGGEAVLPLQLPYREVLAQLGAAAEAAHYTTPLLTIQADYSAGEEEASGALVISTPQPAAPPGGRGNVSLSVPLSAVFSLGAPFTITFRVRVDPELAPVGVQIDVPWAYTEHTVALELCLSPNLAVRKNGRKPSQNWAEETYLTTCPPRDHHQARRRTRESRHSGRVRPRGAQSAKN